MSKAYKKRIFKFVAILCIATVFMCLALSLFIDAQSNKTYAVATSGSASVLNIGGESSTNNFLAKLSGGQTESLYFGTYDGSAIKWRILAVNDEKYGSGNNILLFSDKTLGVGQYNGGEDDDKHSYWGTSKIRATLNGGYYINAAGTSINARIAESDSYLATLFSGLNTDAILVSNEIRTYDYSYQPSLTPNYQTVGSIYKSTTEDGKFNTSAVAAKSFNTKTGSAVNPNSSVSFSSANGVIETTTGDKLFLLDYDDIMYAGYGFVNSRGQTYLQALGGSYASNYAAKGYKYGYPSWYEDNNMAHSGITSADNVDYWLRVAGRFTHVSIAQAVLSTGNIDSYPVYSEVGIRPALVFNPAAVVYANASGKGIGATLENVTVKNSEYKLYTKDVNYGNYNFTPHITSASGKINISFNNPVGEAGKVVLLLTERGGTDGSVAYQATADMSVGLNNLDITLPSDIVYKDYIPTVMLTSDNTDSDVNATENVYCTYTLDYKKDGLPVPEDISGIVYDGNSHWLDNLGLSETPGWIDESVHLDTSVINVKSILYTSMAKNAAEQDWTSKGTNAIKDAGKYKITLEIIDKSYSWKGGGDNQVFNISIAQTESTVHPDIGAGPYYPGSDMPSIALSPGDTQGTIAWEDSKLADGKTSYNWIFTSSENNYADKTGSIALSLAGIEVNAIEVNFTPPAGTVIYTSTSLDSLNNYLTVTKKNNNGSSAGNALASEYKLSGALNKGTSTITVTLIKDGADTNITNTFNVTVEEVKLASITATPNADSNIYTTTKLDAIKAMLTVTGTNNDGSTLNNITSDKYSISCSAAGEDGTLPIGSQTLTLTLNADNSITCNVTVQVKEPDVKSIKAELRDNLPAEVYDNTAVNKLKDYIKVTATYNDGNDTTKELGKGAYTISWVPDPGNTTYVTVSYGGKTTSVTLTNVVKFEVQSISAVSTQGSKVIYSSATAESIKGSLQVTGVYNDDTDDILTPDKFEVILPTGGLSSTNNTVTVNCGDKTTTVTLNITDVVSTGIDVVFTDSGKITVDNTYEDLLSGIKITLNYNDGSSKAVTPTADMLSGDMDSIGSKTITVSYTDTDSGDTHTDTFTVNVGKGTYDMSAITFADKTVTYNGQPQSIEISGDLPEGVTVSYEGNGQTEVNESGYIITAKFSHSNPNYNDIPDKTAKLIISNKPVYDMDGVTFTDKSDAVYDGSEFSIELGGLDTLPDGVTYVYVYDGTEQAEPFKFTNAGTYEVIVKFTGSDEYAPISDKKATLTINAANFDTSTLNFTGTEVVYDGEEHSISIDNAPDWLTVTYEGNGQSEVGEHKVIVKFSHSNTNYNAIADMEVTLKITADEFDVSSLVFEDTKVGYDGQPHSIVIDNLPDWLTVEYEGNEQTEIGSYTITAKFTHDNPNYGEISPITATLTIEKGKIARPVYKGDIRYSGESILPKTSDFEGYNADIMEIVADKSEMGLYVGKYKIVFAILDSEHYEWDKSNTPSVAKVSVNGKAVLALTDEITLEEGEIAVEWSIGKAKLNATKKDGALPIFTSPSYKGAMDEVITYKYYTDKECTEEVAKEDIAAGQTYYVMASLEDSDNFELDTTAIRFVGSSFSYDAPVPEPSTGEKIVQFLKKNWLWLVIALVALIILLIIIILIAKRRKKDDNNGKGNNNPPYPPYNGGQPPYPPYNGGQPPYPPYGDPYGGQPYYMRRPPVMPMAGMIQPQMNGMQPNMNGAMKPQIGMQQPMQPQLQGGMQMQGSQPQIQTIAQPSQVQYVEKPALNAPHSEDTHLANALTEEISRLRGEVEHIKSKSEEENIKLRSEIENARTMSAVESAKMQAISEIERAKNEAKFAMHSGNISEAAATTVSGKTGAGDVLGDALMSAVAKMIVQGSINGVSGNTANVVSGNTANYNTAQTAPDNTSNMQSGANAIPQCPPGGRVTTTTMVDMTKNSRQAQFSTDDNFM